MEESRFNSVGKVLGVQIFPEGPSVAWVSTPNVVYDDRNQEYKDAETGGGTYPVPVEDIGETATGGFIVIELNLAANSPAEVSPRAEETNIVVPTDEELGLE